MAYDEGLAQRLREGLEQHRVIEKKMFGGLAFMVQGHMCIGILGSELLARVGVSCYEHMLTLPHVRPMDFTGRPMRGFVCVATAGFERDEDLASWLNRCLDCVATLPKR